MSEYGTNVSAGGGFTQFTETAMRDFATEGGEWGVQIAFGTRELVSLEIGYIGSLYAIDAVGLDKDAYLLGTALEGSFRVNFTTGSIQPYAVTGGGWIRYDIVNADTTSAKMSERDDLAQIPFGVGVAVYTGRLVLDARAIYRKTTGAELFPGAVSSSLDSWSASLRAGIEY